MKKFAVPCAALWLFLLLASASLAAEPSGVNMLGAAPEMARAEYWLGLTVSADRVLMTPEQIAAFNAKTKNTRGTYCVDVLACPDSLPRAALLSALSGGIPKGKRYLGGRELSSVYWHMIDARRNAAAVTDTNKVRFGAVVRETAVKGFPTDDALYSEPQDVEFDMNMETVLKVWEPVAVLHESADGGWLYVRSGACDGWVKSADVALADRETLRSVYVRDFLVVTGNRIREDVDHNEPDAERPELTMGTRLPLVSPQPDSVNGVSSFYSYVVTLPQRSADGTLAEKTTRIPFYADVCKGFLPYTQAGVIRQAFKILGERYGWGGMWHARDCSAFAKDIYSVFGFELPRNSSAQARIPSFHADLRRLNEAARVKLLAAQPVGAILHIRGHIMLYLGMADGKPYMINDMYAALPRGQAEKTAVTVNCVAVSDLEVRRRTGKTFLAELLDVNSIK